MVICYHVGNWPGFPGSSAGKESTCNPGDLGSIPGSGRPPGEGIGYPLYCSWTSLVAQTVKNLPTVWETWVRSLDWEDSSGGGQGNPLQYSCLENPHGQRGLEGYSPWGHKESGTTEQIRQHRTAQETDQVMSIVFTCNRWSLAIFKSLLREARFCIFQCGLWDDICWYMFAAIMNYHKFRGLDNRNLSSHVSGGQNLKLAEIKELAGRSGSSWRLRRSLFPCSSGSRDIWIVWLLDSSSVFEAGDGQCDLTPCHWLWLFFCLLFLFKGPLWWHWAHLII